MYAMSYYHMFIQSYVVLPWSLKCIGLLSVCPIHHIILSRSLKSFSNVSGYNLCYSDDDLAICFVEPLQQSGPTELEVELRDSKENGIAQ